MKTIKELADELGVNKNKVKYQAGKLTDNLLVKKNGIIYLTDEAVSTVVKELTGEKCRLKTDELTTDYLLNELDKKNRIINHLLTSQDNLQKLLDQEQQLHQLTHAQLKDKQVLLEETQHELEKVQVKKWYQFWR
ncbi:DNA-binding protein [Enterococcus durans]|uniref:DNA-binding protein n=1 Tax=Enterococcus durans TaxID=53345 RepID=UPI001ED38D77|nr:DNA-binding protein [Enterococcus faecium]